MLGKVCHRVIPQHQICQCPFIHLGGERHCESQVSCPRTQHNVPGQGSNPDGLVLSCMCCKATFPSVLDNQNNDGIFLVCASVMALSGANNKKNEDP